jgi:nucleotide-binding universal stress UspA family protein
MIKRIVVPVDFSETSTRAARYAVQQIGPQLQADVVFVTVLEVSDLRVAMSHGLHGFETDDDLRRMVREWMEARFAEIESPSGAVKASRDIRRGLPDRELIEAIQEHKADLVIMGASGIGKRNPIGSKAEHVLANSRVPLMLIR